MEDPKENRSPRQTNFLRYSGLAFQMLALFLLAFWGGQALDNHWGLTFPLMTILFLLLANVGMVISLLKNLPKS